MSDPTTPSSPPAGGSAARDPLDDARRRIDAIDRDIVRLLAQRMQSVHAIGGKKVETPDLPVHDASRETALYETWHRHAEAEGLPGYFAGRVLREVLNLSRRNQESRLRRRDASGVKLVRVAYQGVPGSYSELAIGKLFSVRPEEVQPQGFATFAETAEALEEGRVEYALLPVENSLTGGIGEVGQILAGTDVAVVDEEVLEVEHCLCGMPGATEGGLRAVRSHPVALQQCGALLASLSRCRVEPWHDTAAAAEAVAHAGDPSLAAICSVEAARRNGLEVLRTGVADHASNQTRFLLLAREPEHTDPRLPSKTTLVLTVDHRRGALARCLQAFADAGINLTRLESRPVPQRPWEYQFVADIQGHGDDQGVAAALDGVRRHTNHLRILGSYPDRSIERVKVTVPTAGGARGNGEPVAPAKGGGAASKADSAGKKPEPLTARSRVDNRTEVRVGDVAIGGDRFVLIAGPCAVENEAQVTAAAAMVRAAGARILRGGAFKPRTSPYSFQGLGFEGLDLLAEVGQRHELPVVTEVLRAEDAAKIADKADMLQIGARNMQNFALLKEVARIPRPVLLKRGLSATIAELLQAAEYLLAGGNHQVVLCERGIRTFETATRGTLDVAAIPVLKERTHLPVIVDPSHAAGRRELVVPLALAAAAAGADGLIVECHPNPDEALCDKEQALREQDLRALVAGLQPILAARGVTM